MKIFPFLLVLTSIPVLAQEHLCALQKQKFHQQSFQKTAKANQLELMNKYDVVFHHLDLAIERNTTQISGNVRTIASVSESQLDSFGFELHESFTIDSVQLQNGNNLTIIRQQHFAIVILPIPLLKNQLVDVTIYYRGMAPAAASAAIGAGFSTGSSQRWGNQATWSLSQPYSAFEWWPCKQSLQDKIDSTTTFITTSKENKAGSQGILLQVINMPNDKVRYEWKSTYPISYYLISVAVAKYIEYNTYALVGGDSILVQDYIYDNPATLTTFKPILDQTAPMLVGFSQLLGKYPFYKEKYGHAMAPFSGGMEHQTMTSIGVINFEIVAHELGHMWFGDNVTCETWKDIWLNEGFASYTEYMAYELLDATNAKSKMANVHANAMSQPGGSIWFEDTSSVSRIFSSRLSYNKGSAFVHILRYEINNDSLFFAFLTHYQNQFRYGTANTLAFKSLLEQFTAKDFTATFNQWFFGEGYPIFAVRWNSVNDTLYIVNSQTTSATSTPLFTTALEYLVKRTIGDTLIRLNHSNQTENYQIYIAGNITSLEVDPNNWIMNQATVLKDITINGLFELGNTQTLFQFHPNPVGNLLTIQSATLPITGVTIYDVSGKFKLKSTQGTVDVSSLQQGIYFFVVNTIDGTTHSANKFVKQ